jgi:hypothetical protein
MISYIWLTRRDKLFSGTGSGAAGAPAKKPMIVVRNRPPGEYTVRINLPEIWRYLVLVVI